MRVLTDTNAQSHVSSLGLDTIVTIFYVGTKISLYLGKAITVCLYAQQLQMVSGHYSHSIYLDNIALV